MKRRWIIAIAALVPMVPAQPANAAMGRCPQFEQLLRTHAPRGGWNISKMSRTAWRESRCQPDAVNRRGGDSGLLQIHPITWPWLSQHFGFTVNRARLLDPAFNVQAAAALCTFWRQARHIQSACYRPWNGGA